MKEKWEEELAEATEADYRRQRAELLAGVQWWLRDVWLQTMQLGREMFTYPDLAPDTARVAGRLSPVQAMENLRLLEKAQRLLTSNVQEALALREQVIHRCDCVGCRLVCRPLSQHLPAVGSYGRLLAF